MPKHHANIYYNGEVGKLGIDFNLDYMWRKKRETSDQEETNGNKQQKMVASTSIGHSRMFAEKLVLSYPLWKGQIEVGNEYIASQMLNDFHINMATIGNSNTKSDEKNMAGFFSIGQQLGKIAVEAGLRYEHVTFKYTENGQLKEDQSKTYNNVFPSLSISTEIGKTQWALSYTSKTQRPSYEDLDGTVTYVNRLLLGSGNPYLSPVKIHSVELMGAWKQFLQRYHTITKGCHHQHLKTLRRKWRDEVSHLGECAQDTRVTSIRWRTIPSRDLATEGQCRYHQAMVFWGVSR